MSLQLINEVFVGHLDEEKMTSKRKSVLKTVKGNFAQIDEQNRNGRKYSRRLWENVIRGDYVKEMLVNKTLFGEAEHPSDRAEISMPNVSHVITELKIMADGTIYGVADILDTPAGRILNTMLEYGSNIGISSRGMGNVNESTGYVDEESYLFVTFDFVPMPSVAIARPPVREGVEMKPLSESLETQIRNASDSELPIIERVIESMDSPLFENLQHILLERKNNTEDSSSLMNENQHLKSTNEDLRSTIERIIKEKEKAENSILAMKEEFTTFKNRIISQNESASQEVKIRDDMINRLKSQVVSLQVKNEQLESVKSDFESTQNRLQETINRMEDNTSDVKSLYETIHSYSKTIEKQNESLKIINERYTKLGETTQKYVDRNNQLVNMVAELASYKLGMSPQTIKESIKPGFSLNDILSMKPENKVDPSKLIKPPVVNEKVKSPEKLDEVLILENILYTGDDKTEITQVTEGLTNIGLTNLIRNMKGRR